MRLVPHDYIDNTKTWEEIISAGLYSRPIFLQSEGELQYTRVAKQILGVYDNA